jgi:hypothetical protein
VAEVRDRNGNPVAAGSRIAGWYDAVPYTGTVRRILPRNPGCQGHRHLLVARDGGTDLETTTDAIDVIPGAR